MVGFQAMAVVAWPTRATGMAARDGRSVRVQTDGVVKVWVDGAGVPSGLKIWVTVPGPPSERPWLK